MATEKCRELEFEYNDKVQVARWKDISDLFSLESKALVKLSKLNAIAVSPKPIERQSVSTCLRVFSDETIAALETHPNTDQEKIQGTIQFLKIILSFWKIVNVKGIGTGIPFKYDLCGVMRSPDDKSLKILLQIADMSDKLKGKSKRERQLTKDTSEALPHRCRALVRLACHLLSCGNEYVILGWFTTDPLEKAFSKLRPGSGGTYFITVQSLIEKVCTQYSKLAFATKHRLRWQWWT